NDFFKDDLDFHKDTIVRDSSGKHQAYEDLSSKEKVNYISTLMTDENRETFVADHGDPDRKVLTDYIKQNMDDNSPASDEINVPGKR
ncbi:MAG: hypothetical protein P8L77_01685, partial [Gammaproteobacteria bacterium]|nr:hypothetical protein [Gammaproteobacteria bacterium]